MDLSSAAKTVLDRTGLAFKLRRTSRTLSLEIKRVEKEQPPLPPLLDDPLEAVHFLRGGKPAAFQCPLDRCVSVNGLNFARQGWHPFSETLVAGSTDGSPSLLEQFYRCWQPADARQALVDPAAAPSLFADLPPHFIYWFPWSSRTRLEADAAVRRWTEDDNLEHGGPRLESFGTDGLKDHGPVSAEVGAFEQRRLSALFESLSQHGYDRSRGDVSVLILKRGNELRFLNFGGGLHRTAAMRALGHSHVPAKPLGQLILDVDDAGYWPQVRNGNWTQREVTRYIDHLFDFDSLAWARSMGLQSAEAPSHTER